MGLCTINTGGSCVFSLKTQIKSTSIAKMIIFKDVVSGDELFSDTFKYKKFQDAMYRVEGKMTTEKTEVDDSMFGGNASAEDGAENYESEGVSGIDVVLAHKLVETAFTKKTYKPYIKDYMKGVKNKLGDTKSDEELEAFQKSASAVVVNFILKNFDDFQFFLGESLDAEAMVVLCRWEDEVPCLYFFKDGIDAEKV